MLWEHPGTQRMFIRATDKLVGLKHKNADEYRSEVIHIPKHAVESIRPNKYGYRIDILFRRTKTVLLPEDLANWVLSKFKHIYKVEQEQGIPESRLPHIPSFRIPDPAPDFAKMTWKELQETAIEKGVFRVGINKEELIEVLNASTTSS